MYRNEAVDEFNREVARRVVSMASTSSTGEARPPFDILARVRSEVAAEWFARDHGRAPGSARELSDALRRYARPRQSAVAGYDLSFSPAKSVSALWAVAPLEVARVIDAAHDAAVGATRWRSSSARRCLPARAATVPGRSRPVD